MSVVTTPRPVEVRAADPAPRPADLPVPPVPPPPANGAAAATLLAGGVGCAWFGLLVLLNDASPWLRVRLDLFKTVGPLSGKAIVGVAGWLAFWLVLDRLWSGRDVPMAAVVRATRLLVAAGFVLTFTPFYLLFAAD